MNADNVSVVKYHSDKLFFSCLTSSVYQYEKTWGKEVTDVWLSWSTLIDNTFLVFICKDTIVSSLEIFCKWNKDIIWHLILHETLFFLKWMSSQAVILNLHY